MKLVKPGLSLIAVAAIFTLAGCAPATGSTGSAAGSPAGGSSAAESAAPPKSAVAGGASLKLIDVCSKISVASMASLVGRAYAEVDNSFHTSTASGCDYEGAGGLSSELDLNVSLQTGITKSDVDKILAKQAETGEHAIHFGGLGDYAGAVKDVVVALYGSTAIVAIDSNEPSGTSDLTTAELRRVVKAVAAAAS